MHIIRLEISQREKKPRFARGAKTGVSSWRPADGCAKERGGERVPALAVIEWKSKAVAADDEAKFWSGMATDIVCRQLDGARKIVLDNPYGIE